MAQLPNGWRYTLRSGDLYEIEYIPTGEILQARPNGSPHERFLHMLFAAIDDRTDYKALHWEQIERTKTLTAKLAEALDEDPATPLETLVANQRSKKGLSP